jgi:hypothetical protein
MIYEFYNKQHETFAMEFLCSAVVDIRSSRNNIVNVKLEKYYEMTQMFMLRTRP